MTQATRDYLTEVVRQFEMRKKNRGMTGLKQWETKLLAGAKKLLREEQLDLPVRTSDAELNASVRHFSHAGLG